MTNALTNHQRDLHTDKVYNDRRRGNASIAWIGESRRKLINRGGQCVRRLIGDLRPVNRARRVRVVYTYTRNRAAASGRCPHLLRRESNVKRAVKGSMRPAAALGGCCGASSAAAGLRNRPYYPGRGAREPEEDEPR